ncbi:MAG: hypothetical protein QNJ73_09275 [Gammaproteobacteria bacterium]|nr:hypothetical protein [Gammaproteobacteria bacterium]
MWSSPFGAEFIETILARCLAGHDFDELLGEDDCPHLQFESISDSPTPAGFLRLWRAASPFDRMLHVRLQGHPADTQLFFLFALSETVLPHFHAQVVQFGEDSCVYNADLLPRLDPVDHPEYFTQVFEPITRDYWKATQTKDNTCASAPTNPAIAIYLSPWGLGADRPTDRAELQRVGPHILAYVDHLLQLARALDYPCPDSDLMRARDRRHLACFFDERLDRRAWKGVYGLLGEQQGQEMRRLLATPLHAS